MTYTTTESLYETIDTSIETWDELPSGVQDDLIEWLNSSEPDDDDRKRLLKLYVESRFHAWVCPHCASKGGEATTRVFRADVEDDEWGHFQGTRNQDFSYFGDKDKYTPEYIQAMCDTCRCYE